MAWTIRKHTKCQHNMSKITPVRPSNHRDMYGNVNTTLVKPKLIQLSKLYNFSNLNFYNSIPKTHKKPYLNFRVLAHAKPTLSSSSGLEFNTVVDY